MTLLLSVADVRRIPLADESVQCVVTSPPYWGLRDYGLNGRGIGLEASPEEYVAQIVAVFCEVWRVLRKDGTVWLNLGDSYAGSWGDSGHRPDRTGLPGHQREKNTEWFKRNGHPQASKPVTASVRGLKPKDLVGIPWRVALALQADGWWLRSDIIWHKPNPMPESVRDRPTRAHEYVFLLAKSKRYYYDAEAVKEPVSGTAHARHAEGKDPSLAFKMEEAGSGNRNNPSFQSYMHDLPPEDGRNRRSVWTITTQPYRGAHFATFPVKLVEPMVLAGTSAKGCCPECGAGWVRVVERTKAQYAPCAGDYSTRHIQRHKGKTRNQSGGMPRDLVETTGWLPGCACSEVVARDGDFAVEPFEPVPCTVLDPFGGTMTVGEVCATHGRHFVGLDLKQEYIEMGRERCADTQMAMPL